MGFSIVLEPSHDLSDQQNGAASVQEPLEQHRRFLLLDLRERMTINLKPRISSMLLQKVQRRALAQISATTVKRYLACNGKFRHAIASVLLGIAWLAMSPMCAYVYVKYSYGRIESSLLESAATSMENSASYGSIALDYKVEGNTWPLPNRAKVTFGFPIKHWQGVVSYNNADPSKGIDTRVPGIGRSSFVKAVKSAVPLPFPSILNLMICSAAFWLVIYVCLRILRAHRQHLNLDVNDSASNTSST
jgi:hypothetical protein